MLSDAAGAVTDRYAYTAYWTNPLISDWILVLTSDWLTARFRHVRAVLIKLTRGP